ncbi:hypothetical protein [Pseudomonas huanghezhanensis]|uniref:hypothetical protein n=1 Tax=Pseudomonas huanghezhanensis TaxID=3002903 RepID=UPI0022857EA0|nr:hypothetical protein [Pseudomonas sp. BSw22131]
MIIKLSPSRRDDTLTVEKRGDALILNGEAFDLARLPDGGTLPSTAIDSPWFAGDVHRQGGELVVTLILPLPINYSPAQAYPDDLVDVADGDVVLPGALPLELYE